MLLLLLTACSSTASGTAVGPTCAMLPGFSGAAAATGGPGFSDVPFPGGSISTTPIPTTGGTGLFAITELDACSPHSAVNAVQVFYVQQLVRAGWEPSVTYPYDGQYQAACGDLYCWAEGTAPRLVSLEKVTDQGNGLVTYHLRLAQAPAAPKCPSSPFGGPPYLTFVPHSAIPLPPLTLLGPGTGSGGLVSTSMCSAGTATSIDTFFKTELPKLGFHYGALPASSDCGGPHPWPAWVKGNEGMNWSPSSGTNYNPGFGWFLTYCGV
jgi:hypothetical protein